jgi:hypothetical protein
MSSKRSQSYSGRTSKDPEYDVFDETPRIITPEEKGALIRAHADAREPKDPVQRITLWAGVGIAIIAIGVGWFMTVGYQVKNEFAGSGDELRKLADELDAFTERAKTNPIVNPPKLPGPTTAAAAAQFENVLQDILSEDADSTSTRRDDLLAPSAPSVSSTTEEVTESEDTSPLVPNVPGLIPDPEYSL